MTRQQEQQEQQQQQQQQQQSIRDSDNLTMGFQDKIDKLEVELRELKTLNGQVLDNIVRTLMNLQTYIMDQKVVAAMSHEERQQLLAKQQLQNVKK